MKPYPWKCPNCRQRALSPVTLAAYTMKGEHDGRDYDVTVRNLTALKCSDCGTLVLDDAADDRLSEALRAEIGLLRPDEIRSNREALGLTQKELAAFLQIAESTLSRWETGAQMQQRCMDRLLRCVFDVPEVRRYLGIPTKSGRLALS